MKSRINPRISVKPRLIGYCTGSENQAALREIADANGIEIKFIGTESAGETVGYIAGINGVKPSGNTAENPAEREVLIMAGLKSTVMDRVLGAMREKGVKIDLKCAVTPINQNWQLCALIEELEREHRAMRAE